MTDICIEQYELLIEEGDFVPDVSDRQHIDLLLATMQGEWRQWPLLGGNLKMQLSDDSAGTAYRHFLRRQLEYDGATVTSLRQTEDGLFVDAKYKSA